MASTALGVSHADHDLNLITWVSTH